MGKKIIQPPFYNSGFYDTGAGGGGGSKNNFSKDWGLYVGINENKFEKIKQSGLSCFFKNSFVNLAAKNTLELNLFYKVNPAQTAPSPIERILGYIYEYGQTQRNYMFFSVAHDRQNSKVVINRRDAANNNWITNSYDIDQSHECNVNVIMDIANKKYNLFVNGVQLETNANLYYIPTKWAPVFYSETGYFNGNNFSTSNPNLAENEYLDVEKSYLKIDGELF